MSSASSIANQIEQNWNEMSALNDLQVAERRTKARASIVDNRLRMLRSANYQWNLQYKRLTGKLYFQRVRMSPARVTSNKVKSDKAAAKRRSKDRAELRDNIEKLDHRIFYLEGLLRDALRANNDYWAAGFVHTFSMSYWAEPEIIRSEFIPKAKQSLRYARNCLGNGDLGAARAYLLAVAAQLMAGHRRLHKYNETLKVGGARTIASVQALKSILVTLASGGMNLSPTHGAAIDAVGTGAEELTTLIAGAATGEHRVTARDIGKSVENTVLAAAMAFVGGRIGNSLAGKIGKVVATRFGKQLSVDGQELLAKAIGEYVKSNFKEWARLAEAKRAGKEVKANYIAMLIAPGLKSIPIPGVQQIGDVIEQAELQKMVAGIIIGD